ncbi:zinc finger BED domain-containing protein 1-like isoform X1 [Clarias magur]|uniref:Zinc finger BED domain-containing protein 1-like isoform X1 n=1 Tax=Clarias magur TaxID=1594786 RepID=A0A8J4TDP9_CLAMG|nr:zinc finger BED domain-containing protein 1-like isoform X1 [Clarias magur]
MDNWRDRSGPKNTSRFQKGKRDHPYVNRTLPFKNVYKTQTSIKAESGNPTRPFFRHSWRGRGHEHKPDIKHQPYASLESGRSNRELYHPGSRRRDHDFQHHMPVIKQEPSTCQEVVRL